MRVSISHYRIDGEIGRGGMGVVYRATDTVLGRPVAIKVLQAESTDDPEHHRRFIREAQSASSLNHPNIVTIYEVGEDRGTTFIAMELVDGTPLDRVLGEGRLEVATALDYAVQIAQALAVAHSRGIIHRDIKPANIIITPDGRAKVLDFGLAKLIERGPTEATITDVATQAGLIMGTAAYMAPEQAEGRHVTAQSDIFSFGAVVYEMLAGRRPFRGDTQLSVITSLLRDQPPPVRANRPDTPAEIDVILNKAMAKDAAARYQNAAAMRADLAAVQARLTRASDSGWRPRVLVPVALFLLAAAGFGLWQTIQGRRVRWAREAIPEIERLQTAGQNLAAFQLARGAERLAAAEIQRVRQAWYPFRVSTNPPGADVQIKDYLDLEGSWEAIGQTPLQVRVPAGYYRVRITKAGYLATEFATPLGRGDIALVPQQDAKAGMVPVAGGSFSVGIATPVQLSDFWLGRREVTNQEYKRFVDAGGYRDSRYWKEPFRDGERTLSFTEAVTRFRDATGRTGPASWELGSFPKGQEDFPVGGISWFEASAYAAYAGKMLPTIYHWYRAAPREEISSEILQLSNFDGNGPVKAGERHGLGPWGTLDMAGNVKEWCANPVEGTPLRYILGGGWNEPHYRYSEEDAHSPWSRRPTFGVRMMDAPAASVAEAARPVARLTGDPKSVVPVSNELFDVYRRFYSYDRTPLNARVDSADDSSEHWRRETISFDAAYAAERVPAHLFLPKNAQQPYQTVIVFPSRYAVNAGTSQNLDYSRFDFIIRSGRAVIYPIYQGTYERRRAEAEAPVRKEAMDAPERLRDLHVQWAKDFFRAVDYLQTRQEIDNTRLAYYSLSMGAFFGPIPLALEPRIKTAVLLSGGLRFNFPPEIHPANFMPHVKVPVLLINGRDDFQVPLDHQRRFFELLGTPPEMKRHVVLDGGHVPVDNRGVIREVLDWLDRFLGPVK